MIGILDSGVGGLAIYQKVKTAFPKIKVIYMADTLNFPYGNKSAKDLELIVDTAVEILLQKGAKVIIVACNTATVATICNLRRKYDIPIIGVEPAVKMASEGTRTGKICLIGTERTISDHNNDRMIKNGQTLYKSCQTELVNQIEENCNNVSEAYLATILRDEDAMDVDSLVLGCTHYIFLKSKFEKIWPRITFYEPSDAIVKRLKQIIKEHRIDLENGADEFLVSAKPEDFQAKFYSLFEQRIENVREV